MPASLLAVDDDPRIHALLERALAMETDSYTLCHATSPEQALKMAGERSFHLALVDLHYAGSASGFSVLSRLKELDPGIELIVMSNSSRFDDVRDAMRAGAGDYLAKGFGRGELVHALERALERRRWKKIEKGRVADRSNGKLLGGSAGMVALREKISKYGPSGAPVLITGETGTGKELAAAGIHSLGGDPAAAFVPVNCAALPASTIDSFFFGHERGAFTGAETSRGGVFEEAEGGTLFLDEINSLPLDLQGRLLRVLQEKRVRRLGGGREHSVDFRLVTATNQPLEDLVRKGTFREDLYFRIGVLRLEMPPLRDRMEDLDVLCAAFLPARTFSEPLKKLLHKHSWPGNVRELRNLLQALDVLAIEGEIISVEHLPEHSLKIFSKPEPADSADIGGFVNERESREREFLARAYRSAAGNVSAMARVLGVDRSHLHQKLVKAGIHESRR